MQMDAVHRGARRMRLVQVIQIVVDKVREGFGSVHRGSGNPSENSGAIPAGGTASTMGRSAAGGTSNRTIESAE